MSGNIIIAAGLFLLAIQLERIALVAGVGVAASSTPVDDLESHKINAVKEITKIQEELLTDFEELIGSTRDGYLWVTTNNSLIEHVMETASDSNKHINQLAEDFVQQGKTEGKSKEYFDCVEENRNYAVSEIEEKLYNYLGLTESLREKAKVNIENSLNIMKKLSEVVEGVYKSSVVQISLCEDKACISEVVREAQDTYARSHVALETAWKRSIRIILHFKSVAREGQLETEQTIAELMKNGQKNMEQC